MRAERARAERAAAAAVQMPKGKEKVAQGGRPARAVEAARAEQQRVAKDRTKSRPLRSSLASTTQPASSSVASEATLQRGGRTALRSALQAAAPPAIVAAFCIRARGSRTTIR